MSKKSTSYGILVVCILLVALNVGLFVLLPKAVSVLSIILSNVVTLIIAIAAAKPFARVAMIADEKKAGELAEKIREEEALRSRVTELENRNRELSSTLDSMEQTASVAPGVNYTFKLETMTYDKTGYVVKEEPLSGFLDDPSYKLPGKGLGTQISKWVDNIAHPGEKKVLYIGKYYVKASLGIDFTKIKFAVKGDGLEFFGVRFSRLNDLAVEKSPDDVNLCWVLSGENTVNTSDLYADFTREYARIRADETSGALEKEVDGLCEHYTDVFRRSLSDRFPFISFCDHIEDSPLTWYSLKDHMRDARVGIITSSMLLMADVMSASSAPALP